MASPRVCPIAKRASRTHVLVRHERAARRRTALVAAPPASVTAPVGAGEGGTPRLRPDRPRRAELDAADIGIHQRVGAPTALARSRSIVPAVALSRDLDHETHPVGLVVLHPDLPLVLLNDAVDDGQTQPAPPLLGGEVGDEELLP